MRNKRFLLAGGAALVALAVLTPTSSADPSNPTYRPLSGAGSDTTQDVLNGLSQVVPSIGSYNASGTPDPFFSKDPAGTPNNCQYTRAEVVGSSNGVSKLQDSLEGVSRPGCLDFARSSSNSAANFPSNPAGGPGQLSYVPFAVDALTYAVRDDSPLPSSLSIADLRSIYDCELSTDEVKPLIPQAGSGTRQFFLQALGYTSTQISQFNATTHPCVSAVDGTGAPLLENTGTLLTHPLHIAPYSVAQYLSQTNDVVSDVHGRTVLGQIDGKSPTVLNTASTAKRDVYNVIPTNKETTAPWSTTFVGGNSSVCQQATVINKYGFGTHPSCGVISIRTS